MEYVRLIPIFALLAIATVSTSSDITVEGDVLKLIAEYDLTDDTVERTVVDEAGMAKLEGQFPFRMVHNNLDYYYRNAIVYFDSNGDIGKVIRDGETSFEGLFPIGENGYYTRAFLKGFSLEGRSFVYKLYDADDNLITETPSSERIITSPLEGIFLLDGQGLWTEEYRKNREKYERVKWLIYNVKGEVIGRIYEPTGYPIEVFENGVGRVIAGDVVSVKLSDYPNGLPRGTRVFDLEGSLLFNLNETTLVDPLRSNYTDRFLIGSDNYIFQLGFKSELSRRTDEHPEEIYEVYAYSIANNNTLEAYDSNGDFLWDYDLNTGGSHGGSLFISDNEKYLCLIIKSDNKLIVFDTSTGDIVREIEYRDGKPRRDNFLSDDGTLIVLDVGTGIYFIKHEEVISVLGAFGSRGIFDIATTKNGVYIVTGSVNHLRLYTLTA